MFNYLQNRKWPVTVIASFFILFLFIPLFLPSLVTQAAALPNSENFCLDNSGCSDGDICVENVCQTGSSQQSTQPTKKTGGSSTEQPIVPLPVITGDPRCYTEADCQAAREELFGIWVEDDKISKVFYQGTDTAKACEGLTNKSGDQVGFCSAAGPAKTAVTFGTTNTFNHIGDFIKFMYKYAIWIAGILAVFVIMIAGLQWILSAGSPERITAAKKKISGAMMGLFLVLMSYFILNAINPYMVNLRLPQVWMIQSPNEILAIKGSYCNTLDEDGTKTTCEASGFVCNPVGYTGGGWCKKSADILGAVMVALMTAGAAAPAVGSGIIAEASSDYAAAMEAFIAAAEAPAVVSAGVGTRILSTVGVNALKLVIPANVVFKGASAGGIAINLIKVGGRILKTGAISGSIAGSIYLEKKFIGVGGSVIDGISSTVVNAVDHLWNGGHVGICLPPEKNLRKGEICDPDMPGVCATGSCLPSNDAAVAKCWSGYKTGFCSDGLKNAYCREGQNDDCAEDKGFKCALYWSSGMGILGGAADIYACSDGSENTACDEEISCKSNLVCWQNRCTQPEFVDVTEFGTCKFNSNCGEIGQNCWTIQASIDCSLSTTFLISSADYNSIPVTGGPNKAKGVCMDLTPKLEELKAIMQVYGMTPYNPQTNEKCW